MPFKPTIHVQTTIGPEHLATIANGLSELGLTPRSMSDLVAMALETLSDILVANGHTACVEPLMIEEILDSIGRGRRRRLALGTSAMTSVVSSGATPRVDPFGAVTQAQALEQWKSRVGTNTQGVQTKVTISPKGDSVMGDEIEVLPSVADEGEFDPSALDEIENGDA